MPDHPAPPRVALADRPAPASPRAGGASAQRSPDDSARRVDTPDEGSVSFARPDARRDASAARPEGGAGRGEGRRRPSATTAPGRGVPLVAVRPVGVLRQVSGYPIQPSKVQRPPLRDDVLSRSRLNDLLDAKSSHRVVLVVAEAGYGKTTMLADWTRRTSRRVLWYRLDTDDRDWLGFLHHIVAAGRVAGRAVRDRDRGAAWLARSGWPHTRPDRRVARARDVLGCGRRAHADPGRLPRRRRPRRRARGPAGPDRPYPRRRVDPAGDSYGPGAAARPLSSARRGRDADRRGPPLRRIRDGASVPRGVPTPPRTRRPGRPQRTHRRLGRVAPTGSDRHRGALHAPR